MVLSIVGSVAHAELQELWPVVKKGNYVFCAAYGVSYNGVIVTIDVTDKTNPAFAACYDPGVASNLWDPACAGLTNLGDMWLTSGSECFTILDLSDPLNLTIKGQICDPSLKTVEDAYITGDRAIISSWWDNTRVSIIDISNPNLPVIAGSVLDARLECAVGLGGGSDYAFSSMDVRVGAACDATQSGLTSISVSDPLNPSIVDSVIDGLGYTRAVFVHGNFAYLAKYQTNRVAVYDISNPAALALVGSIQDNVYLDNAMSIYVNGNYAAVLGCGYLTILDVSNPAAPGVVDHTNYDIGKLDGGKMWVEDGFAYCPANCCDILSIVDVSTYFPAAAPADIEEVLLTYRSASPLEALWI